MIILNGVMCCQTAAKQAFNRTLTGRLSFVDGTDWQRDRLWGNYVKRLFTVILALLLVFAGGVVVLALISQPVGAHPFFQDAPPVQVIAHQGGDDLWPSNTLYAMERAVTLGVDVLEMDVHATRDGVLVLSHDETVERLTDGSGLIKEMTLAEIEALDAAYDWTPDDVPPVDGIYPLRGQGIAIPTLEEIFEAFPGMPMNIEVKQQEPPIVEPFCQLLRQYGKEDEVLVASFHPEVMVAFRQECPEVATSATEREILPFYILNQARLAAVYRAPAHAFQVPEVSGGRRVVTERFVNAAHAHNVQVHVWTVDDPEKMARLIELGVDGIITDRPDLLLDLLNR